jgi:hypothetical protein
VQSFVVVVVAIVVTVIACNTQPTHGTGPAFQHVMHLCHDMFANAAIVVSDRVLS